MLGSLGTLAYAQQYSASLVLDPIASSVSQGDDVTFSGTLMTSDGKYVISGKTVYIKDDIAFASDTFIATVVTDTNGKFSVTWTATPKQGGNYNFYAVFEGDSQVGKARSTEYTVSITSPSSTQGSTDSSGSSSSGSSSTTSYYYSNLILDSIPSVVNAGDTVTLSGILLSQDGKYAFPGRTLYIKDDVAFDVDTILGTIVTDTSGKFYATWKATPKSNSGDYNIYADFEGDSQVQKARSQEYKVTVISQSTGANQGSSSSSSGSANRLPTEITLDPIPSQVYAENEIVFSGILTSNGQPLANALVHIQKDIPAFPDEELAYGNTDANGQFSIHWTAQPGEILKHFGVYAIFEGSGNYAKVRGNDQYLTVQKYVPQITLDQFPTSANVGDVLKFSGTLQLYGASLEGDVVFIKDEVSLAPDNLLATAYVDGSGHFSTSWIVRNLHSSGLAHIYAVFEGDKAHSRVTTCDTGPTSVLGGSCSNTIVLSISGINPPPPPQPPPQTKPEPQLPPATEKLNGNEYVNLYYSLSLTDNPVVAISPSPDSYSDVQRYVTPVENGIRMWQNDLQQKYGGNWNVEFEVLGKDLPHFDKKPDMIINIVTQDKEVGCVQEFGGLTYMNTNFKPVNIEVCANNFGAFNPDGVVSAYAAHEFIHAMGLGHAWNKEGDLMCSYEMQQGQRVDTCPNLNNKSPYPSDFDLAAVAKIYGVDGFENPNNAIVYGSKLTANEYQSNNYGGITNPGTTQFQGSTDQSIEIPSWVRNNAKYWSLGQMTDSDFASGIQYLIKQGILKMPFSSTSAGTTDVKIPFWVKSNAKLWAAGEITDQDFVKTIQYLISVGMIKV
jgi:hypothetical protein